MNVFKRPPWRRQPQTSVGIDWSNPITKGLVFATADGKVNAANGKKIQWTSSDPTKSGGNAGLFIEGNGARYADLGITLANSPLTLFATWLSRTSSQYLSGDSDRNIFSTRTAGNAGFSWGRSAALAGGAGGNVTRNAHTVQGVAQYFASAHDIPSLTSTAVAITVSGTTLKHFTAGALTTTTTIGAGTNGGNLIFLAQGPSGGTPWLDRAANGFAFNRTLSEAEVKSLSDNPWQIFLPLGRNLGFSPPASGPITHPASGDLLGGAAVLTGTATRLRAMTSSGALVGGGAALAGTARSNHQRPTAGVLGGAGATLAGTAARAGGAVTHPSSGVLVGQGATLAGTAARTPAVVTHAASGALSGQGAVLAGAAARVAAPVTHATSGALTGPGATLSGTAQNGTVAPPIINSGGGAGGGARVKNRRELDDLLAKALKKPVEVAVQLLLPAAPSPEAISTVIRALEARDATANKSAARQAQSLLARLQVLEREAEDEEAAVMTLLLD